MILNGKKIAEEIYTELKKKIAKHSSIPCLGAVLVGENSASLRYINQKRKFAQQIGMDFRLFQFPENISESELITEIQELNNNIEISGYIVQLPLPHHIHPLTILSSIDPKKDVDGFHPLNQGKIMIGDNSGFIPCTPAGIMQIFEYYDISLSGKSVCIVGRSNIVGKPLALLCINKGATVISCNSKTPDISLYTQTADIIIMAAGQAHLLQAHMVSPSAIIIDVGFSLVDGKIYGDSNTSELAKNGNTITPVPGGVGPMTVAMLLSNTYIAHERSISK